MTLKEFEVARQLISRVDGDAATLTLAKDWRALTDRMERVVNEDTILQKDTGQVAEFMGHFFRIANMPETISSADLFRQLCKHPYVVARDNCGQIIACKTPDELLVVPQPEMIEALGKATDERLAQVMRSYVLMKRSLKSLR